MRGSWLVVLAALAAGIGIGYALGTMGEGAPPAGAGGAGSSGGGPAAGAPARPAPEAPAAEPALRAWLDTIPVPAADRGTGVIRGHVLTPDGAGLAGVLVTATVLEYRGPPARAAEPTLEEQVRDLVEHHRRREAGRREARTGPDGAFVLEGLAEREYNVWATLAGYEIQPRDEGGWNPVRPGAVKDFVATPVASLALTVLLPDGTEPEQAWIDVEGAAGRSRHGWAPGTRTVSASPGDVRVRAVAGASGEYASDQVPITLAAGARPVEITLRLRASPGLRVRVVLPPGEDPGDLAIRLVPVTTEAPPTGMDLMRMGIHRENHRSLRESMAPVFAPLPPGEYWVLAVAGSRVRQSARVAVADALVEQDLVVAALDRSEYALVWVEGPDGKPVAEVRFSVLRESAGRSLSAGVNATRQADGSWRVPIDPDDARRPEADARYTLEARTTAYGAKAVPFARGPAVEIRLRFEEPGRLEVTLTGLPGHLAANRIEVVLRPGEGGVGTPRGEPGTGGTWRFDAVAPGGYDLVAQMADEFARGVVLARARIDVKSGANSFGLAIPPLSEVTVLVPAEASNATLTVQDESGGRTWHQLGAVEGGQVRLPPLPPGTYALEVHTGRKRARMEFSVPCASPLTFTAMTVNALRVRIRDAGGPFARLGLRDGDLVVGIDGKEFESEEQMFLLMAGSQTKESVTFMVLRGGAVVSIPAALGTLMEGDPGGSLEPASR